jgi:hypothetical protein
LNRRRTDRLDAIAHFLVDISCDLAHDRRGIARPVSDPPEKLYLFGDRPHKTFAANAARLQLAYNLGNFLRTLAMPEPIKDWPLTSVKEKLTEIGARAHYPPPACLARMPEKRKNSL